MDTVVVARGTCNPSEGVVRQQAGRTLVHALDPDVMVRVPERDELRPIAEEASRRIDAALANLRQAGSRARRPRQRGQGSPRC